MELPIYYIIRPTDDFRRIRTSYGLDSGLEEPDVWMRLEVEILESTIPDRIMQVKLIYLAHFWNQMNWADQPNYKNATEVLMGKPPLKVAVFDKWWNIERIGFSNDFGLVVSVTDIEGLKALGETGNKGIDKWVEEIIKLKKEGKM